MTGPEMMIANVLKLLGFDPTDLKLRIESAGAEVSKTVTHFDEKLTRIENTLNEIRNSVCAPVPGVDELYPLEETHVARVNSGSDSRTSGSNGNV